MKTKDIKFGWSIYYGAAIICRYFPFLAYVKNSEVIYSYTKYTYHIYPDEIK